MVNAVLYHNGEIKTLRRTNHLHRNRGKVSVSSAGDTGVSYRTSHLSDLQIDRLHFSARLSKPLALKEAVFGLPAYSDAVR